MGKRWFITRPWLYKLVKYQWLKFQLRVPAGQLVAVSMRKYQGRHKSNIKTPTHWSRCSGVYTALLCSLAFCPIRYKGPQKQICWYYDFFQTLSSFLWVLCHQNRASHRWLVYEQILDQVPWHLPIKKVVCLFLNRNQWKENGSIPYCFETTREILAL